MDALQKGRSGISRLRAGTVVDVEKGKHLFTVGGSANCVATIEISVAVPQRARHISTA